MTSTDLTDTIKVTNPEAEIADSAISAIARLLIGLLEDEENDD